jgi:4-hydroxythreonine-4-phosphate dehydrogenase
MKKIAISVGDISGIGIQLCLENHKKISKLCKPIYCINQKLLIQASKLLNIKVPKDFNIIGKYDNFKIKPKKVNKKSGKFSYDSFLKAIKLVKNKKVDAICTLPINKESWAKADIHYVGHTDMLRDIFKKNAIMMLGCDKMFVALYTEHIALKKVHKQIKVKKLTKFLIDFAKSINLKKVAVLGLNPHAGDNGVLGDEEIKINKAIKKANKFLDQNIFQGTFVPDIAFTPTIRANYKYFIAMYHDQGLAPLKALYFDEAINVSLNLPIIRTSVDHGTAFDIAYNKNNKLSTTSYINAIKEAVQLSNNQVLYQN